jgi:hypothetical protein
MMLHPALRYRAFTLPLAGRVTNRTITNTKHNGGENIHA